MSATQRFVWSFEIPVPRPMLWRYVADTERINRLAGLFPVSYSYQPRAGGGAEVHGEARVGTMRMRWVERPCEWVEPRYFRVTRDYQSGPFRAMVSSVELSGGDHAGQPTRLQHTMEIEPRGLLGALVTRVGVGVQTARGLARAYALAPEWAAGQRLPVSGSERVSGRAGVEARLRRELLPLGERLGCADAARQLLDALVTEPDSEIFSLAPYALADGFGVARRAMLRLLLHATRAGLFDMQYNLICPSCRRSKEVFSALADVTGTGHCPSCNITFGVDFDRAVEVRFSPEPLGIGAEHAVYCHSGPRNTPHRQAGCWLRAGSRRTVELAGLEPGAHQLHAPGCEGGAVFFEASTDADAPRSAAVGVGDEGLVGVPAALRAGEPLTLELDAAGLTRDTELFVVRAEWADDAVSAAEVTALQEFRDLFSSEVLAPGAEFAVRSMSFLFSDLVDSTALYERLGDGPAFALVRDHFELLHEIYSAHDGALVKTIGDAVMAVFRRPADALAAALDMRRRIAELAPSRERGSPLRLKIGLHRGPCIAMEANGRVDYFGTTVNLAARVQGRAGGDEIALSPAMVEEPGVARLVGCCELGAVAEDLELKGLSGSYRITRLGADKGEGG